MAACPANLGELLMCVGMKYTEVASLVTETGPNAGDDGWLSYSYQV